MAAGNNGSHHIRKALYGALKDSTKVGLAKVNSENKVGLLLLTMGMRACAHMHTPSCLTIPNVVIFYRT